MKNLSRNQLIKTYLMAHIEGLADVFINQIKQEMQARKITLQEVNDYYMNEKEHFVN